MTHFLKSTCGFINEILKSDHTQLVHYELKSSLHDINLQCRSRMEMKCNGIHVNMLSRFSNEISPKNELREWYLEN